MKLKLLTLIPLLYVGAILAADTAKLETDQQKLSYIFGIQVGQNMKAEGIDLDLDAFKAGVADILAGKQPQLKQEEAKRVIGDFQKKQAQKAAEILNKKQQAAKKFMAENAKNPNVKTTKSGIQYEIIKKGDGATPTDNDTVIVHYKGSLIDGTVFDSSYDRGKPATFPVKGVIPGFREVLKMMKEGGKWHVVIPPKLAYGMRGAGPNSPIGPNETLVFDIELVAITKPKNTKK